MVKMEAKSTGNARRKRAREKATGERGIKRAVLFMVNVVFLAAHNLKNFSGTIFTPRRYKAEEKNGFLKDDFCEN
jgi:hypothetical protein